MRFIDENTLQRMFLPNCQTYFNKRFPNSMSKWEGEKKLLNEFLVGNLYAFPVLCDLYFYQT